MIPNVYSLGGEALLRVYQTAKFKTGLLSFTVQLPLTRKNAVVAPLLFSVLRRGTKKYPTLSELNRRLDYLYGTEFSVVTEKRGDCLVLGLSAEILDASYLPNDAEDILSEVLGLMKEILFCPVTDADGMLREKYVESEKLQQRDAIRNAVNQVRSYAIDRCQQKVYEKEPFGIPLYGTEEETMSVTRKELTDYWEEFKKNFCPEFSYIGSESPENLQKKIKETFPFLQTGLKKTPLPPQKVSFEAKERRTEESLPVSQGHLLLAFRTDVLLNHKDFYALTVLNALLGGSPVSRLFTNVREKLSLCYTCSSFYQAFKGGLFVYCGLKVGNKDVAEEAIRREVEVVRNGEFSEEELESAKRYLVNSYRQMEDSAAGLERYFAGRFAMGVNAEISDCLESICKVTKEDVVNVAKTLHPDTVYFMKGTLDSEGGTADVAEEV